MQSIPSFVRFYRDYSIADSAFMIVSTLVVSYTSYSNKYVRTGVCEELSRHPELMRDMVEMGLNVENCELWFERAVVGIIGIMFILIVIRVRGPSVRPQLQLTNPYNSFTPSSRSQSTTDTCGAMLPPTSHRTRVCVSSTRIRCTASTSSPRPHRPSRLLWRSTTSTRPRTPALPRRASSCTHPYPWVGCLSPRRGR